MKGMTIRKRLLRVHLASLLILFGMTAILFHVVIRFVMERELLAQLHGVASRAEEIILHQGPGLYPPFPSSLPDKSSELPGATAPLEKSDPPDASALPVSADPPTPPTSSEASGASNASGPAEEALRAMDFEMQVDRALRDPLSVIHADFLLLDGNGVRMDTHDIGQPASRLEVRNALYDVVAARLPAADGTVMKLDVDGRPCMALLMSVSRKNSFGLGWIVVFAETGKWARLQWDATWLLFGVMLLSAAAATWFSSRAARDISRPFSRMNRHLGRMMEGEYGEMSEFQVDGEMRELVQRINRLSQHLSRKEATERAFLQNATHELRSPLMSIRSHAEGIQHEVVSSQEGISIILQETGRMTRLVDDLLYLSRLEAGPPLPPMSEVDPVSLLKDCCRRNVLSASEKGLTLVCELPEEKIRVQAEPDALTHAVGNLVDNGLRHARSCVWVRLNPYRSAAHDPEDAAEKPGKSGDGNSSSPLLLMFEIEVEDDGPGIAEEDFPHLFERFYKGKNGHAGLGLSIAGQVAQRMGATLTAENTDIGAKFTLQFFSHRSFNDD